jgi:dihydrofolate synthase/folylpolyglutamate synthase
LLGVLEESFSAQRRLLIFATSRDKDARGMLRRLLSGFDQVIFTRYLTNPRAVPPQALAAMASELTGRNYGVSETPADAWEQVYRLAMPEDLICVTGSFFLAGELRRHIRTRLGPLGGSRR